MSKVKLIPQSSGTKFHGDLYHWNFLPIKLWEKNSQRLDDKEEEEKDFRTLENWGYIRTTGNFKLQQSHFTHTLRLPIQDLGTVQTHTQDALIITCG